MKKIVGILILCVLVSCGLYYVTTQTNFFHIKSVVLAKPAQFLRPSDFATLMNLNLMTTPKRDLEKLIEHNPYIESFTLQRLFPSSLQISCVERQEFAAIHFNGLYIIIDPAGIVLDIRKEYGILMLLDGFDFESVHLGKPLDSKNKEALEHTIQLMLLLKQNVDFEYQVTYKKGIEIRLSETMTAKFGQGEDIQNQFVAFMTIYEDIMRKGILGGVIDVSKKKYYIFKPID